jgi:hypothetical protein
MKQQPKKTITVTPRATETTRTTVASKDTAARNTGHIFDKSNIQWMVIGGVVMIIGFLLMAGGKSPDPNVFNKDAVYSPRRITVAPILILIGFIIEIYAIFRTPKK